MLQSRAIGDFCKTGSGTTPPRELADRYYGGEIPWVKSGELREAEISDTEEFVTNAALKETSLKIVPAGALLVAMYGANVGRVGILRMNATTNQAVCHIIPDQTVADIKYMFYALRNLSADFVSRGVGGAQPNISQKIVQEMAVPLPPLDEQRRIAAILDQADALRRKRREALEQLEYLGQQIFHEMFVDESEEDWPIVSVEEVGNDIRTGPFGSQLLHSEFTDGGIAVLGIDNAVRNEFAWNERRFISLEKYQQLRRYTVRPGDLLITIMGTCGRCAIVPDNIVTAINTKHLCCITLDEEKIIPTFLHATFLQHPDVLRQLGVQAKGAVMPGLNMGIIKSLTFALPPLGLQRAFAARVAEIDRLKAAHRAHLATLDALFATLQHRAFRGEL